MCYSLPKRRTMTTSIPAGTLEKFTTFGDLLRFLRRRVGITQMELSIAVGYSDAQISRLEQNLRLPDIPTIDARFVPALGLENEPRVVARLLDLAANVRREDAPGLGLCPYKGLSYFDEADADLFVGREELTTKLTERILHPASSEATHEMHFMAVIGASGSGKSSLVRAGLVPALRWNKQSADWQIYVFTPTAHPLESLATSLTEENNSVTTTATLMDDLSRDSRSLHLFARRKLGPDTDSGILLVIDQFEELFALCRSEDERVAFIRNLLTASSEADGPVIVVITLRADFYAHCADYSHLREALAENQEYIGAMNQDELRRAIEEPAQNGRWEFESGLVDVLLHDVNGEPGALPLLSHALLETWKRRRGRTMTLSGYASSGGVHGAIAETAESVFTDQLTKKQQSIARRIFTRLTELSDETTKTDTRRRAKINELILKPEEAASTRTVLKLLADARLIITSEDTAEVAHEALIREWPTLRNWLNENRDSLRLQRQLTEAAQEWQEMDRSPDLHYRGARLAQISEWALIHEHDLNVLEREFLEASIQANEREAAEKESQRQRELEAARKLAESEKKRAEENVRTAEQLHKRAVYLTGAFFVAIVMAVTALFFGSQARKAAVTAQTQQRIATSRELAAASINQIEQDPDLSILLALEAVEETYQVDQTVLPEAEDALHRTIQSSRILFTFQHGGAVAFSPDKNHLATGGGDGAIKIWDMNKGQEILTIKAHLEPVVDLAYNPTGNQLASVGLDDRLKVWNPSTGGELLYIQTHMDDPVSVDYSPDGKYIAVSGNHGAKVWNTKSGDMILDLADLPEGAEGIKFSSDGNYLVTNSFHLGQEGGIVRIWDAATGRKVTEIKGMAQAFPSGIDLSSDGGLIASPIGQFGPEAIEGVGLWRFDSRKKELEGVDFLPNKSPVSDIKFNPKGTVLAVGGHDGITRLWDVASGSEILTLGGHEGQIRKIDFHPDGKYLATTGADNTTRVWDISLEGSREWLTVTYESFVFNAAFSPDGEHLAISSELNGPPIIDSWTGDTVFQADNKSEEGMLYYRSSFSPDGARIATPNPDNSISIWDINSGSEAIHLVGHPAPVTRLAFDPNGMYLASSDVSGIIILWDSSTGEKLRNIKAHAGWVPGLTFNADGSRLASASWDSTAKIWDEGIGKNQLTLNGHDFEVWDVAFSPDGSLLATAAWDSTAKVWDANTGDLLFTLPHPANVNSVDFDPKGKFLATGGFDSTVRLWDVTNGKLILAINGNQAPISSVDISPDGKRLVTSSADGTVRVFALDIEELMELARNRVTRLLTEAECQKYLHLEQCPATP